MLYIKAKSYNRNIKYKENDKLAFSVTIVRCKNRSMIFI